MYPLNNYFENNNRFRQFYNEFFSQKLRFCLLTEKLGLTHTIDLGCINEFTSKIIFTIKS